MKRPPDIEEIVNELSGPAADLLDELDPLISQGRMVTPAYYEARLYQALNTLASIAMLPTTDPDDAR